MRIGYFGGSFDPPHRGHLAVARAARDAFHLDRVLLAPTGKQPLKPDGPAAPFADRLAMTELLCAGEQGLEPSAIDAPRPNGEPNFTADTLARLRADLPADAGLFAILGIDAFLGIPQWRRVPDLFDLAEWIVVSRPGFPLERTAEMPLTAAQKRRIHTLNGVLDPASATGLRARLRQGETCDGLLPPAVWEYIRAHGLYRG